MMTKKELLSQLNGFLSIEQPLPHMVVVRFSNGSVLQSYDTIVGLSLWGVRYFDRYVFYHPELMTRTTMKHTKQWSGMTHKDVERYCDEMRKNTVRWIKE